MVSNCSLKSYEKSKKHGLFYKLWCGCKKIRRKNSMADGWVTLWVTEINNGFWLWLHGFVPSGHSGKCTHWAGFTSSNCGTRRTCGGLSAGKISERYFSYRHMWAAMKRAAWMELLGLPVEISIINVAPPSGLIKLISSERRRISNQTRRLRGDLHPLPGKTLKPAQERPSSSSLPAHYKIKGQYEEMSDNSTARININLNCSGYEFNSLV